MTIYLLRTARTTHVCSWCDDDITIGTLHVESKLPPGDQDVCNDRWLSDRRHLSDDCYGLAGATDHDIAKLAKRLPRTERAAAYSAEPHSDYCAITRTDGLVCDCDRAARSYRRAVMGMATAP